MYDDIEKILITKAEIEEKVRALAAQLDADYRDKNPLMLCILKGSVLFFSDIVRNMKIKLEIDFMAISSYGAGTTSGIVRLVKDLDRSIEGRARRHRGGYRGYRPHAGVPEARFESAPPCLREDLHASR